MLEKLDTMIILIDLYGPLLTEKQQNVLQWYYEDDLSLIEIADDMGVSKQAVYDLLKRAEKTLCDYEGKLQLMERFHRTRDQLEDLCKLLEKSSEVGEVSQALKVLREMIETA